MEEGIIFKFVFSFLFIEYIAALSNDDDYITIFITELTGVIPFKKQTIIFSIKKSQVYS